MSSKQFMLFVKRAEALIHSKYSYYCITSSWKMENSEVEIRINTNMIDVEKKTSYPVH